ncbi:hypothetical protein K3495_g8157 [Podosphaera aphanis]|nr:hypothetical protein K3495_g8157 [Podosphaera aphanis]
MSMSGAEWSPNRDCESSEIIEEPLIPDLEALLFTLVHGVFEDLVKKIQAFAEPLGYSLAKKRIKVHRLPWLDAKVGTIVIRYSKGYKIQAPNGKMRKRSFRMTERPFQVTAHENRGSGTLNL